MPLQPGVMPGGVMTMPGAQGGPGAAPMAGQSLRGQAGAQAVGDGAVSWMDPQRSIAPGAVQPGMAGPMAGQVPGASGGPGQSMMGQAGAQAVGAGAVSWMGKAAAQQPGVAGQSLRGQQPVGPGAPTVSQLTGQIAAPGAAAVSQLTGQIAAPGAGAVSQLTGAISGPGAPTVSQLTGQVAAPGQGARSLLDGSAVPAQPGQSMIATGASGGPGQPPPGAAAAAQGAGADAAGRTKAEGQLVAGGASGGPELKMEEAKANAADARAKGADGGPGAASEEELVDPDADRPNFGASGEDEEAAESEESAEDSAFASIAARVKPAKPLKASKPIDPAYVTAAVMAGAILSLGLLIWLGRSILMDVWPGISGFYERIGAQTKQAGDGLKIAESSKRLQRIGGIETLVVRGFISNISDVPEAVPNLRLELYNEKHEVIQDADAKACAALLDPRGTCEFEVRLELPQIAAAKGGYAVVWAK
jgi:hypothetical protein